MQTFWSLGAFAEILKFGRCRNYLVGLVKSFPTSIHYLLADIGFDTAENEPFKVTCQFQVACKRDCMYNTVEYIFSKRLITFKKVEFTCNWPTEAPTACCSIRAGCWGRRRRRRLPLPRRPKHPSARTSAKMAEPNRARKEFLNDFQQCDSSFRPSFLPFLSFFFLSELYLYYNPGTTNYCARRWIWNFCEVKLRSWNWSVHELF